MPVEGAPAQPSPGAGAQQAQLKCKVCGSWLSDSFTFCASCGDTMCLNCAVKSNVPQKYQYTQTYIVADRIITIAINFPRCTRCHDTEEYLTTQIRERLRPYHGFRWKSIDVRNQKYADEDSSIVPLQQQLQACSCPKEMLACPRCGKESDAHKYSKFIKRIQKGEIMPKNLMMGPFGEGGKPMPDVISCKDCGYQGVFISGWGLKKFLQKNGPRPLEATIWRGVGSDLVPGARV